MNDHEIIEKKDYLAKFKDKEFAYSMSPEESKAVHLKKCNAANQSAGDLTEMSLTDDDAHVVASYAAEKKELAAKEEDKVIQLKKLGKLDTNGADQDGMLLFPRVDPDTGGIWFEPIDHHYNDDHNINNGDDVYQSDSPAQQWRQRFHNAGVVMGKYTAELF